MKIHDEPPAGAPEWLMTYGDLMSLLLTIFVMLVSMGELKQTDKFQGVADSLHEQFGTDSASGLAPGELRPRNSTLAAAAIASRLQRRTAMGIDVVPAGNLPGDQPERLLRPGERTTLGIAIYFAGDSAELSNQNQAELQRIARLLSGKPHTIEVRGHSAPASGVSTIGGDPWELAFRRARATMQFLVDDLGLEESRIRISAAGLNEPARLGPDTKNAGASARVEVFLLDEEASQFAAAPPGAASQAERPAPR